MEKLICNSRRGGAKTSSFARVVALVLAGAVFSARAAEPAALTLALQGDNVVVTVPANALYDTSRLYLVWGAADCGSNVSAWPVGNRIQYSGTLTPAGGTITFDGSGIPAGSIVRAIATSDVRLIGGWVKMETNQYIDTGVKGTEAYGIEIKMRPTGGKSGDYAALAASTTDNFTIGRRRDTLKYYLRYRGGGSSNDIVLPDNTIAHSIKVTNTAKDSNNKLNGVYVDGQFASITFSAAELQKVTVGSLGTDAAHIFIGTSNNGSGNPVAARFAHAEWHYAQLLNSSGKPMLNLVPALRGDTASPTAFFYDSLSGDFFDNAGTGGALAYDTSASVTNTITYLSAISDTLTTGVTAWWTGNGNLANVNDPANWACTNAAGAVVAGAYPDIYTVVKVIGSSNFNVPAGQALSFNILHFENCSLSADCDWSGLAASTQRVAVSVLEYLEAPNGAYIDTGFKPNNKSSVIADVTVLTSNKSEYWFGAWNVAYNNGAFAVCNDGGNLYTGYGNNGGGSNPRIAAGRHTIHFTNGVTYVDGSLHTDRSAGGTFQVNHNLYIFGQNRAGKFQTGQSAKLHIHSLKIFDDGVLVRDYVPVLRNDGEYCFYERVSHEFAYNVGTGAFAGGYQTGETVDIAEEVSVPIDFDVDLAGHSLTLVDTVGSGTITDTAGGGELHLNVGAGKTLVNTGITFAGQLKLVKDGAGTFVGAKADQTYTGGTVANAGWLKQGAYNGSWGPHKSLITICKDENADTGAGFDWNGMANDQSTTAYSFKIAGAGPDGDAAMKTAVHFGNNYWNANYIADMELDGNATVKACLTHMNVYGFVYRNAYGHNLVMNGHTLTVAAGDAFAFRGVTVTGGGTIVSVPDTSSDKGMRRLSFYGEASDLSSTTLDVHDRCGLNLEKNVTVKDFIDRRTLQWNDGTSANNKVTADADSTAGILFVIGRFKPLSTNLWSRVTLGDATHLSPTFDLSALEGTFEEPAVGDIALNFAEGANVNIDVGSRVIAVGDKLISWRAMPACSFTLVYSGEARPIEAVARTDGLYVKSSAVPSYAVIDMEAETPDWVFYDVNGTVVPDWEGGVTAEMQVRFASYEEYLAVRAKNVSPFEYLLTGSFTLPAGSGTADMASGFDFTPGAGVTIDVAGRTLTLPDSMVGGLRPFTVTSSVAGGELVVEVAGGATITNSAMSLTGDLKLVKDGAGTFVGAKSGQSYTGGTVVNAGLVKSGVGVTPWGAAKALVTVADTGAAFDWNAMVSTSATPYNFNIKGTGINGGGAIVFTPASAANANYNAFCLADLELSGDALMKDPCGNVNVYCGFIKGIPHALTLNGYTLTIDAGAKFNFCRLQATDSGTIVFMTTQSGLAGNRLASFWDGPIDLSGVTFDMGANCALNDDANNSADNIVLGTLIDRRTGAEASVGNKGMTILDRFQPMTTNLLQKAVLGDATHLSPILDLSALDGPFVLPAATYTLTVAEGATVQVKLGGRRVKKSVPLITWTTKPASIDNITFAACDRGGSVRVKDDGVYFVSGLMIIVR